MAKTETAHTFEQLTSVMDLALARSLSYGAARDAILRGTYGQPVRVGGRLYVRLAPGPEVAAR